MIVENSWEQGLLTDSKWQSQSRQVVWQMENKKCITRDGLLQKSKDKRNGSTLIGQGHFTVAVPLFLTFFFHATDWVREIDGTPATPSAAEVNSSVLPSAHKQRAQRGSSGCESCSCHSPAGLLLCWGGGTDLVRCFGARRLTAAGADAVWELS